MHTPRLLFAHANGYTPGAYRQLLSPLQAEFALEAPALRPLRTGQAPTGSWDEIAHDLGLLLDAGPAAVGVGHSLGAMALLMAAAARPARLTGLVLIDPPALPAWATALLRAAPQAVRGKGRLAAAARRRTEQWATREAAYAHERQRRCLSRVSDEVLADVLGDGLENSGDTWRLRFRTAWEARLYETPSSPWPLLRQRELPPMLVLRGAQSGVFTAAHAARWQASRPHDRVVEVPGAGHLLPLEQPARAAELISAQARSWVRAMAPAGSVGH